LSWRRDVAMRLALSRGSKRVIKACLKPSRERPRWTAKVSGDKTERFLPRSASWIEEMEKRSHRRIRDLDVLTAFQGLVANEIGCARISMMARKQETLPAMGRIQMRKTNYLQIVTSGFHRTAGPYKKWTARPGVADLSCITTRQTLLPSTCSLFQL